MRQAEKEKKTILVPDSVHTRPGQESSERNCRKNSENLKTAFRHYFQPKRDEIGREREKKKFSPEFCSYSIREIKFQKKQKKNQKIKKPLSGIIFSQNGMRQSVKERKKFQSRIPFILGRGRKLREKIAKKFKKLENNYSALFLAKTG